MSLKFVDAVTVHHDFGAQENKVCPAILSQGDVKLVTEAQS